MRTLVSLVAVCAFASAARADAVKLKITQAYEKTHAHVNVDAVTRAFLAAAHVAIDPRAPVSLTVELEGRPRSNEYEDPLTHRRSERFINADVSGTIEVQRDGKDVADEYFSGDTSDFPFSVQGGRFASRAQAPFQPAFDNSTFVEALADALEPVAGSESVVRGLEAIARGKLAAPLRESALCRLAGEPGAGQKLVPFLRARKIAFEGDALKDLHDPRKLCLVATARIASGLSDDAERAELAKRYVSCLTSGGWCSIEDSRRGWCGRDAKRDVTLLRALGQPLVDELIAKAKTSFDDDLVDRVFERIGALGAKDALPVAIARAKESGQSYWRIRHSAVIALGHIGDESARATLEDVAKYDPEKIVSTAAADALKKISARNSPDGGAR